MRAVWIFLLVLVASGCFAKPEGNSSTEEAPTTGGEASDSTTPQPSRRSSPAATKLPPVGPKMFEEWTFISHANGSAALRTSFRPEKDTECSVFFAVHHPLSYSTEADLTVEVDRNDEYVFSFGGDARSFDSTRVNVGGYDTRPVTNEVVNVAYGALYDALGYGEEFTSWLGLVDLEVEKGEIYNLTVQAARALDGGTEETMGGSLRVAADCKDAVELLHGLEDPATLWLHGNNMRGETDVTVDPFLVDVHIGSTNHETANLSRVHVYAIGLGQFDVRMTQPESRSFQRTGTTPLSGDDVVWWLDGGKFHFDWSCIGAALAVCGIRVQSWATLPSEAFLGEANLPF